MPGPRRTKQQGTFLLAALAVAVLAVACGRASEAEINQALGITPTATASAAQMATGTAAAAATADARTAVAAAAVENLAAGGSPAAVAAAVGDVSRGRIQFLTNCQACHGPAGNGGNLLAAGGPGATIVFESVLPLIREGTGHSVPPGPYPATRLTDSNIRDLVAFVRAQAGG